MAMDLDWISRFIKFQYYLQFHSKYQTLYVGSGKSHFLYTIFILLLSRPNYGCDGKPLVLFIPESRSDFKTVLECVKLAFHHDLTFLNAIKRMEEAPSNYEFEDLFADFDFREDDHFKFHCSQFYVGIQDSKSDNPSMSKFRRISSLINRAYEMSNGFNSR